ncbi:hypothetical protein [Vibrio crassostreae]|uniref:hypothetical protein n=1 Tax=Vibrio crassostreae TaxID=246167 RepID=UPI0014049387
MKQSPRQLLAVWCNGRQSYLVETCTTIWKLSTSAARAIAAAKPEVLFPKLV